MTALLLILVLVGQVLWTLWAGIDAMLRPDPVWRDAGMSRALVLVLLVLTCTLGTLAYFLFVRPRLERVQRDGRG